MHVVRQMMMWWLLVTAIVPWWFPTEALASLAPAQTTASDSDPGLPRAEDLQKVQRLLENKIVRQRLQDMGLNAEEITARLDRVSDIQMHQLAVQIDALMPGGDDGTLTTIALVLLIVVLVLLLAILI
jgi:Family of unknown function (DUF6627)